MSLLRFKAVKEASDRKAVAVVPPKESPEKYYAEAVFNRQRMYEYLPKKTFDRLVYAIDNKQPISRELADSVAAGMSHRYYRRLSKESFRGSLISYRRVLLPIVEPKASYPKDSYQKDQAHRLNACWLR